MNLRPVSLVLTAGLLLGAGSSPAQAKAKPKPKHHKVVQPKPAPAPFQGKCGVTYQEPNGSRVTQLVCPSHFPIMLPAGSYPVSDQQAAPSGVNVIGVEDM